MADKPSKKYEHSSLDQNWVRKDTVFQFRCTQCGQCCRNIPKEDKILISPVDLYRIANVLDMEIPEIIEKHCDMVPGGESMIPLLILKERMDGSCTFLKKGKCSVHDGKPITCALQPLGRVAFLNEETNEPEFHYHLREFVCGAQKDESWIVQYWLDRFDIEKYDECVKLYKRLASFCSKLMHEAKTIEDKRNLFSTAFFLIYAKYDYKQDLYGQLAQNLAFIQSINPGQAFDPSLLN